MIVDVIPSEQPLVTRYDVALLDLDGVVYVGAQAIDGVPDALAKVRAEGMRLAFVTNNASRTPQQVADLLSSLGVPARPEEVITSSQAAAHYLSDRLPAGSAVLVLGGAGLIEAVTERGLRPVFSADEKPVAVVQGYSPDLGWRALAEGMVAITAGALWVATNLDPTVPSPRGPLPGNGSLVAALRHASGQDPIATGKPDPTMHAESVQRSRASHPIVVGDRLDTDIEGGRRADCASLLVLTGVTDGWDLLHAPALQRPDFVGPDVGALLASHPAVESADGRIRCRDASADISGTVIAVRRAGRDSVDLLRVLATAAWQISDAGGQVSELRVEAADRPAIQRLGLARLLAH